MFAPTRPPLPLRALHVVAAVRHALIHESSDESRLVGLCRTLVAEAVADEVSVVVVGAQGAGVLRAHAIRDEGGPMSRAWSQVTGPPPSAALSTVIERWQACAPRAGDVDVQPDAATTAIVVNDCLEAAVHVRFASVETRAADTEALRVIAIDAAAICGFDRRPQRSISPSLLNVALDEAGEGISLMEDESPTFSYVNKSAAEALGYSPEELTGGMGIMDIDPDFTPERWDALIPLLRERRRMRIESVHRTRDGHLRPVEVSGNYFTKDGRTYNLAFVRDISERRAAEAALRRSAAHLRSLVTAMAEGVMVHGPDGRVSMVNPAAERITGRTAAGLIGAPADWPAWGATREDGSPYGSTDHPVAVALATGAAQANVVVGLPCGERSVTWTSVNVQPVPRDDGDGLSAFVVTLRDISEQRRAEEALRESEQRFRQVTENIDDVFWLKDASTGAAIYLSRAADCLFGEGSALLESADAWRWLVHPDDRGRFDAALAAQATAGYDVEYRIQRRGEVRWVHERGFPVRDADGRVRRVAGIAEDVTDRYTLELQLRQSQKMEAVGQLAGGVAHDFNNLLAVVQMQASLLLASGEATAAVQEGLEEILTATERAGNLTRQLLTFSRRQVARQEELDVAEVVGTMTKLLRRVLGEDITLETHFAPGLPLARADRGMVEQVLMNLALNARDAMPRGGCLSVALDIVSVGADRAARHQGVSSGPFVCLSVSDTGSGIPAAALPHVFEPFFTTKDVGKGTGLGLATVFGILQQHKGWIEAENSATGGATFRAYLPALAATRATPVLPAPMPPARGGRETILFVEDEPAVRAIMRTALTRFGYTVIDADSGPKALELWPSVAHRVDLLVTDVLLPGGISGGELADAVTSKRPDLPVVFTTGYGPDFLGGPLAPGRRLLPKPFSVSDFTNLVRQLLDEHPSRS